MDSQSAASPQGCLSPAPGTLQLGSARHPLPGFLPPTEARAPVRKGARRASPSSPEADGSRAGLQSVEHPQRGRVKREQLLGKKAEASPAFLEATDSSWCRRRLMEQELSGCWVKCSEMPARDAGKNTERQLCRGGAISLGL